MRRTFTTASLVTILTLVMSLLGTPGLAPVATARAAEVVLWSGRVEATSSYLAADGSYEYVTNVATFQEDGSVSVLRTFRGGYQLRQACLTTVVAEGIDDGVELSRLRLTVTKSAGPDYFVAVNFVDLPFIQLSHTVTVAGPFPCPNSTTTTIEPTRGYPPFAPSEHNAPPVSTDPVIKLEGTRTIIHPIPDTTTSGTLSYSLSGRKAVSPQPPPPPPPAPKPSGCAETKLEQTAITPVLHRTIAKEALLVDWCWDGNAVTLNNVTTPREPVGVEPDFVPPFANLLLNLVPQWANSARVTPLEGGAMQVRGTALYLGCNLSPERLSKLATDVDWLKALKALDTAKSIPGNLLAGADLLTLVGGAVLPCSFWWVPRLTLRLYPDGTVIEVTENCAEGVYWQRCKPFENDVLSGPIATVTTTIATTPAATPIAAGATFGDVPAAHWAADQIGRFAARGITTGCDTNTFCPERGVTRAEMAVFVDRTLGYGRSATAAAQELPAVPTFADVPMDYWAYAFIEQFAQLRITTGCGGGEFCPERGVTRAEMAAFLIRALRESELTPATPTFADVPASHPQYGYVEALVGLGVTTGCGTNEQGRRIYCPDRGVTRAEMAVFITRAYP